MSSKSLLYFVDDGYHYTSRFESTRRMHSEGLAYTSSEPLREVPADIMIEEYAQTTLTCPGDVLRALSGIFSARYGNRVYYGLPCDDFDRAILWEPYAAAHERRRATDAATYPSWSWISVQGRVRCRSFHRVPSFAHWAEPDVKVIDGRESFGWVPIDAPEEEADLSEQRRADIDPFVISLQPVAAQAWLEGCNLTTPPKYLRVDCGKAEYLERLQKSWLNGSLAYTREALKSQTSLELFDNADTQSLAVDGRLAVHTQRAILALDWDCRGSTPDTVPGPHPVLIRTCNHRAAGSITLDEYSVERLQMGNEFDGCFIALSVTYREDKFIIEKHVTAPYDPSSVSRLYGCPCSIDPDTKCTFEHIVERPEHDMFCTPDDFQEAALPKSKGNEEYYLDNLAHKYGDIHERAFLKHMADLSYFNVNGEALHPVTVAHEINVMLVGPSQQGNRGGRVFEKLGIGRVYLKRWVEASPIFETVVLE
jgi:hypothetical protein